MTDYYFKEMDAHPSKQYLNVIDKPMMILQGEKDVQVFVESDYAMYQTILKDNKKVTFKLYPKLNHLFFPVTTSKVSDYNIKGKVDATVLKDISNWILNMK